MEKIELKQKFIRAFSQILEKISDEGLKEKILNTWTNAAIKAHYTFEDLLEMPFTISLNHRTDINIIEHTLAVAEGALCLAEKEKEIYGAKADYIPVNIDYLLAGALLHDVGKLLEFEKIEGTYRVSTSGKCMRHPIYGAALAFDEGIPEPILNAIACHSTEGDNRPRTKETWFITHIDFALFDALKHKF